MTFRADLHCHSCHSDGSHTPFELLHLAHKRGLQGLSITDHDTLSAYTPALFQEAAVLPIQLLPGVECSSDFQGRGVHILGYGIDIHSLSFQEFLQDMQEQRRARNRHILHKLAEKGILFSEEDHTFLSRESCGRPHIAEKLVQKGHVHSRVEAFELYLKDGASCFVEGYRASSDRVIQEIHQAYGKAVLAHPGLIHPVSLCRELLRLPFDGIECYYAKLPHPQIRFWLKIAEERHWIPTGGSDFHGSYTPHLELGCAWVGEKVFHELVQPRSS